LGAKKSRKLDVAVIGGGPAGISTCLGLSKTRDLNIALFESEVELGGIPRSQHIYFGLRDLKRIYTGAAYARKLAGLIRKTAVHIHTKSTVLNVIPGDKEEPHQIRVLSPEGICTYESRFVILSTGCYEASREERRIPGLRPAGIFTTGSLNTIANLQHLKPSKRALIIGSEHVAFSAALTLKFRKIDIAGLVEEDSMLQTYPIVAKVMSSYADFPIYRGNLVKRILGRKRVEAVELETAVTNTKFQIECDTVVFTGKFRPDASLIYNTPIQEDPFTLGPAVDMNMMTTVPNIFAAGNIMRGAEMHDICALEGKQVAKRILSIIESKKHETDEDISLKVEHPIRYVAPQKICPAKIKSHIFLWPFPGFEIQVKHTLENHSLEAWSGNEIVYKHTFKRLIANTKIPLQVDKFEWKRVDAKEGVTLKLNPVIK